MPWLVFILPFLVAIAGVGYVLYLRDGDGGPGGREIPEFTFEVNNVRQIPVDRRARGEDVDRETEVVHALLDTLYTNGFVDPRLWEEGTFPGVRDLFAGRAARRAARDLGDLTLGGISKRLELVNPREGKLNISFLVDERRDLYAAVADTRFRARSLLPRGDRLQILHVGTWFLRPIDGAWRIVGYEVEGAQDSGPPAAGATP